MKSVRAVTRLACKALGVEEVSVYGFTQDNTRRPTTQANQFRAACVAFAGEISRRDAAQMVIVHTGNSPAAGFDGDKDLFPLRDAIVKKLSAS